MYSQADINLIWKHKHPDFKGSCCVEKNVTYPAPHFCLGRIADMPEELFASELKYAKRREQTEINNKLLVPLMTEFAALEHFKASNQWRESNDEILIYASWSIAEKDMPLFKEKLLALELVFNEPFNYSKFA